jgi:hypothetical protein
MTTVGSAMSHLRSSGNYNALSSAKLDQMRLDGEPNNAFGLALAAGVINARDEVTEGQRFLAGVCFHRETQDRWMGRVHCLGENFSAITSLVIAGDSFGSMRSLTREVFDAWSVLQSFSVN